MVDYNYTPPRIFSNLGKLPNTWISLAVMILAGASEGIGLALFVPIVEIMSGNADQATQGAAWLTAGLEFVGLPRSVPILLVCVAVLVIGGFALTYLQAYLLNRGKYQYVKSMRHRLFKALFQSDWHHLSTRTHGDIVNNLLVESTRYGQSLAFEVKALALIALIIVYLAIGAALSIEMLLVVFVLGGLVAAAVTPLMRRAIGLGQETHTSNRDFSFFLVEALRSSKLIKVTASEELVENHFQSINEDLRRIFFRSETNSERIHFSVQALPVLALTIVIGVAHLYLDVETSVILVFLVIIARLAPRLTQLQQTCNQYILRAPTIPAIRAMIAAAEDALENQALALKKFDALETEILFEGVCYRFPETTVDVLTDISIRIAKHEMVALIGSSGAGKSTLVDMLASLRQPTGGAILIDGTPLTELDARSWRRRIGYVTQEITLFNDTLRNNLCFVHPEATDDELWESLRMAELDDVIRDMPDGLETMLGENGVRLSGGQRQRLALARALVGKPEIILLDEATSALDSEVERAIQKTIDQIAGQLTVIIVSHRLSTVRNANRIYVIEQGRVVEDGSYDELVASNGRFAELHKIQAT